MNRSCLSIILAAGEGTRMKSSSPKIMHKIAGLPLICHVTQQMETIGLTKLAIIVGRGADEVMKTVSEFSPKAFFYTQTERLGTAHAVLAANDLLEQNFDDILVAFGDTPLIEQKSLQKARDALAKGADIVVMGFKTSSPSGYGRLIEKKGQLIAIIEEKDATDEQKKINFCNGGLMAINGKQALSLLKKVNNHNAKKEYYLTDIVSIAAKSGLNVRAIEVPYDNIVGVNTRVELAEAENIWQKRKAHEFMLAGVTLLRPETVYFSYDTKIESDVIVEPNVYFGVGVKIETGAIIHGFSHIEGAVIGKNCEIGPYARLRPGADLQNNVKVGNFCEVKSAKIAEGVKINHLSYIGDAKIGENTNIGAGTITCNYDGFNKWKTIIGQNSFIGSNSSLVAPVVIGEGAYIASGSVITQKVEDNSLAVGRSRQVNKQGHANILREKFSKIKQSKNK